VRTPVGDQARIPLRDQLLPDRDALHPFDIEVIFLYPVAIRLRAFGAFALYEIIGFVVLLVVAFVYVWRRGALEWK
jgi:hypothetical protein